MAQDPKTGREILPISDQHLPLLIVFVGLLFLDGASVHGQTPQEAAGPGAGTSTEGLQKATQNPVASLISVPIQNNSNFGIGPFDRTQNVLNIQPVIPVA